jgi:hypothetical protein
LVLCLVALLVGSTSAAQADATTQLPFSNQNEAWLAVDSDGGHVFVSGGPGTSSIAVLDYAGAIVKTITGEGGASQMALDPATHTLYVALHDATAISEIDTQTLTETKRFSTDPYPDPTSLVIAGGKLWFSCNDSGQGGCLVSANLDGTGMATPISATPLPLFLAAGGSNNHLLAFGYSDDEPPNLYVYDVSGSTPSLVQNSFAPNNSAFTDDMTFDPSGAHLLLATGAPYYIQSLTTNTLLSNAEYPTGPYPVAVAVTADGNYVAGGINTGTGEGNDVFVYPVGSTTPVRTWALSSQVPGVLDHSLAFSPDASQLFAVTQNGTTGHLAFNVLSQPTVPLAVTSTSLARTKPLVRYGDQTTLTTQVTGTTSGTVDLYATPAGGTQTLVSTANLQSGTATFTVKPTQNTTYSAQLEEGSGHASSTSQNVSVEVAPIVSVSARADGKARLHGHHVRKTLLTARENPSRPNEPIAFVVQRKHGTSWRASAAGAFKAGSDGTARAFFYTNKPGTCRVRVVYGGDTSYAASTSAWKTFRVRKLS